MTISARRKTSQIASLIAVAALLAVPSYLFLFSKHSSAYQPALEVLFNSRDLAVYLGDRPSRSFLVGVREKLSASSCSRLTFYVTSAEASGFVAVILVQAAGQAKWSLDHLEFGWLSSSEGGC